MKSNSTLENKQDPVAAAATVAEPVTPARKSTHKNPYSLPRNGACFFRDGDFDAGSDDHHHLVSTLTNPSTNTLPSTGVKKTVG